MNWILSANPEVYDIVHAFHYYDFIDWRQSNNQEVGDIIYIYCSGYIKKIRFKCRVEEVTIPGEQINHYDEFWINKEEYLKSKTKGYMRLSLQQEIDSSELTFEKLKENGLKGNLRGPMKLDSRLYLLRYIEKNFDNDHYKSSFPEEIPAHLPIYEGHKKTISVNQYERSPEARRKCIEHHGCYCQICHLNFEKMYGSLGKGFIHVHHIIPLSQIGDEYEVDYVNDLIPVCPNCHAMLHRKRSDGSFLSPEELKEFIHN